MHMVDSMNYTYGLYICVLSQLGPTDSIDAIQCYLHVFTDIVATIFGGRWLDEGFEGVGDS